MGFGACGVEPYGFCGVGALALYINIEEQPWEKKCCLAQRILKTWAS